ncbi:MAG: hypothetical protein IT557_15750 [Alphaproteobacteria bacterium]|nr:hypothetical protein [Alphaproteobacteria bacterium]
MEALRDGAATLVRGLSAAILGCVVGFLILWAMADANRAAALRALTEGPGAGPYVVGLLVSGYMVWLVGERDRHGQKAAIALIAAVVVAIVAALVLARTPPVPVRPVRLGSIERAIAVMVLLPSACGFLVALLWQTLRWRLAGDGRSGAGGQGG